jgi:lipase chaperone LimK
MEINQEWIDQQRQISEIVDMVCEDAPGSVVPLLKQIEKSQAAALDALEVAYAEIAQIRKDVVALVGEEKAYQEGHIPCDADRVAEIARLTAMNQHNLDCYVAENEKLKAVKAERDAAVAAIRDVCDHCGFHGNTSDEQCRKCECQLIKWRGLCAENAPEVEK